MILIESESEVHWSEYCGRLGVFLYLGLRTILLSKYYKATQNCKFFPQIWNQMKHPQTIQSHFLTKNHQKLNNFNYSQRLYLLLLQNQPNEKDFCIIYFVVFRFFFSFSFIFFALFLVSENSEIFSSFDEKAFCEIEKNALCIIKIRFFSFSWAKFEKQ